jgi:hypothetical protein
MPVLMTLCVILSVSYAISLNSVENTARIIGWASAGFFVASLVSTIIECSDKSCYWPVERQQPAREMEKDKKPLGILSRYTVLAASDRFRAFVS